MKISPRSNIFLKKKKKQQKDQEDDEDDNEGLRRMESTSSYMQARRNIYVNMTLPQSEYDDKGKRIHHRYASNLVRTAKYTPISFVPKNLFEQFRNVANLYFLFLVILQCIPLFGVTEPAVSALPLICILIITAIKDGFEDWKRNSSDDKVNNSLVLRLSNWDNVNVPELYKGNWYYLHLIIGFFSILSGSDNKYAHNYRQAKFNASSSSLLNEPTVPNIKSSEDRLPLTEYPLPPPPPPPTAVQTPAKTLMTTVRKRSDTIRSGVSSIFNRPTVTNTVQEKKPYRPGSIPHSVLYRISTRDSSAAAATSGRPHSQILEAADETEGSLRPMPTNPTGKCADAFPGDPPAPTCQVKWTNIKWKELHVGDYVMLKNDQDIPADIVVLSTSETDNVCYVETQNLDGETNLKQRQGLPGTAGLRTEHDCERARFYIESEPPHVNIYQYNAVLRWQIDANETDTVRSGVSHEKADAVTYNNILLRGCVLRNTKWAIGIVVYTGNDTKIMLNTGRTPSKRSKMAKATNPHVIANFVILAIICVVSSIMDSVQFHGSGSSRHFDYGIEGSSASYSGFLTFWVTLILYQNIVPISLYISVEIVKTLAAYFIFADLDIYHKETDTPCIPKTWNISDDLGQIEYIFSDKTGTLTQNVMEYRKCTINGVSYGNATTEATMGALKRQQSQHNFGSNFDEVNMHDLSYETQETLTPDSSEMEELRKTMFEKQAELFKNPHIGPNPTFVDPKLFDDLEDDASKQATAITHFYQSLALCHTVIAERPDQENQDVIEYKAQSPDEAALVATARDMGFVFLGRDSNKLLIKVKGEEKTFVLLNVLEFNSTRKRMSVIIKPMDSDHIVLLCKGADSVIYERLCTEFGNQTELGKEQEDLRDSTSKDLEHFANEGLRTLCLSYRFISPEEYKPWNKRFQEATASIHNREERVDSVSEEIEQNMLLMGGTAIEDRLQDGVPETIAELAKSGIKLWVLTGDKTETAINIGFASNLLTTDMELLILRSNNRIDTAKLLDDTLEKLDSEAKTYHDAATGDRKYALVIDGTTLKYGLENATREKVLDLGMRCSSVICCRVSPKQKAQVVNLVKKGLKVMTLAIGDGANDVSMIQEANVGIGISGVEGRQAVMASDYAIAQFRYLRKLLLVHGRWSYLRTSEMIMGFFFKNVVWTFVLFWYQIFCQFNGSMMFDYALVTLYNLIFTSLPIIFLGIWDQDLNAKMSLKYPQLYRMGLRNDKFKVWRFWLTIFDSIFQSTVCFFFPYMLLIGGATDPRGFDSNGLYEIGTIVSGITVSVANFFVVFSLYSYTWIQVLIITLSILVYYAFVGVYSQFNTFIFAGQVRLFGTGSYWLVFILTCVACYIPRITAKHYLHQYYPYDNDIIREIELVINKGRYSRDDNDAGIFDIDEEIATEPAPTTTSLSYQYSKEQQPNNGN